MKRREFLQGALAVAAVALLPKAVQQPPAHIPGALIFNGEEAGRRLMEEIARGINQKPIVFPSGSEVRQIFWSDDGRTTWQPMGSEDAGWFSFGEPSQEWITVDKLTIETNENIDLSAYDSNFGLYIG